jgi:branched-chain amino acid transport system substrate-binding protein
MLSEPRKWAAGFCLLIACVALAACGGGSSSSSGSSGSGDGGGTSEEGSGGEAQPAANCGLGNGKRATGEPIKLGALVLNVPGIELTPITTGAQAYFDCVNDNGGINGRPISYKVLDDTLEPQQSVVNLGRLIEGEKVLGFVGNASVNDCIVNAKTYEKEKYSVLAVGVVPDCFNAKPIAPVNGELGGPLVAAKYMVEHGAKKIVSSSPTGPGSSTTLETMKQYAEEAGVEFSGGFEQLPITDPSAVALQLAEEAGSEGGVVMQFVPTEAIKILNAAAQLGLVEKAQWGCGGSCVDASIPKALGPAWEGKFIIGADAGLISGDDPDATTLRYVQETYTPDNPLGAYAQVGYIAAKYATEALLELNPKEINKETVNKAFSEMHGLTDSMECRSFYFGSQPYHFPSNVLHVIAPKGEEFEELGGCLEVPPVPITNLKSIRAYEAENGLAYKPAEEASAESE